MVGKILGYILAVLGVIGLALWAVPEIKAPITMLNQVPDMYLIIASAVLLIIGLFLSIKGSGGRKQKVIEVPIYQGKNIVGYRRH